MLRQATRITFTSALLLAGAYGLYRYERHRLVEWRHQQELRRLEEQKKQLEQMISRLTAERRVAEIVVIGQTRKGGKVETTTLMFLESSADGGRLPPRYFTIKGDRAHIDALVIKFERDFVQKDDPLRGRSIVLFYRIFGDEQTPADGFPIDEPGKPPQVYRAGAPQSPEAAAFEAGLWADFWRLADDHKYRESKGVRVAQGESPWTQFRPDRIYTLTLEAAGGLNLTARPMDGLFRQYVETLNQKR